MTATASTSTVTARELREVAAANASGKQPVVFIHGLWLLASAWDPWRRYFEDRGFATVAVDWPDDPESVAAARENPTALANKRVGQVADHISEVLALLDRKPVVIGHSFGGLHTQIQAGRGLARAAVAIDPAPFRGVLPLPFTALKASFPVLGNPFNVTKAVTLTPEQFRYSFTNAVSEEESRRLYDALHVAAPARSLFQAATANIDPTTDAKVDTRNDARGPLLVISGENDHIVPWRMANAAFKRQRRNQHHVTEIVEIEGVGHSLVFDSSWQRVADTAYDFLARQGVTAESQAH
ncbi:MAG TPA: alpha/beta hydrolase [Nocardioidaceae bacterium]|nr:alpha/beta hydrolase [Nocardioidaceae bacterium]